MPPPGQPFDADLSGVYLPSERGCRYHSCAAALQHLFGLALLPTPTNLYFYFVRGRAL